MTKFIKGNEAVVVGALYAGCDAFFGYPITPASEIAHAASAWFPGVGRVFLQAECETASINMVYGAAAAGRLAMTATSGPGMSLMQEGISYMAGAELPGVIVNVQRAGPGLGNVYPEQGDYNQAVKGGGHGNYHSIVLAPGNVQEMCDLTIKAFDYAFRHRNPVIVLADAVLGQMMETLRLPEAESPRPETSAWAVQGNAATRGNLATSIFLNAPMQEAHNLRLQAKYAALADEVLYEAYLTDDAAVILTGYGISSRIARSAVDELRRRGVRAGLFRPLTLTPFPSAALRRTAAGKRVAVVELSSGQYRDDVAFHLGKPAESLTLINRMGGILVTVEQVVDGILATHRGNGHGAAVRSRVAVPVPAAAPGAPAGDTVWEPPCPPSPGV
ncbi:MAG: 3-methyl-2-oxobutanoate dehydrogenase subunit VorB [FCB group bacterium]|jgi:2-oxoisovalerate ferredoxin oxidoreductase alpha subunit|nr:3-methyl-2-oxobutanoate dehydrogenase subunit VorB [FCB group bacterium]